MRRYWNYLKYVLRHKWFVMLACFSHRLIWRGIMHDLSKFLPSEFIPYARFFYNKDGTKRQVRDRTGYYKPTDTGDAAFDFAWLLHQKRNKHHWQWWILPTDEEGVKLLSMPAIYILEMYCDWVGAGRAQGVSNWQDPTDWWRKNNCKMQLHPNTRKAIEQLIEEKSGK